MRRAAKVDANHVAIVEALRAAGCSVVSLAAVGGGCPDLAAGRAGKIYFLECKDGSKPPSARKLTKAQIAFRDSWRGNYTVVECVADALRAIP